MPEKQSRLSSVLMAALRGEEPESDAYRRFLDDLVSDHGIADRKALKAAITQARIATAVAPIGRAIADNPDTLDDLDEPLALVIQLLSKGINFGRLMNALAAESGASLEAKGEWLVELVEGLEVVRQVARRAHLRQRKRGPRGRPALHAPLWVLEGYWYRTLHRPVTLKWDKGMPYRAKRAPHKPTPCAAYLYAVIKHILTSELPHLPKAAERVRDEMMGKKRPARKGKPR